MSLRRHTTVLAAAAAVSLGLAACADAEGDGDGAIDSVEIIVPADPGGGWDQTGRTMQAELQDNDLVSDAQVINVGGAGGTVGLAQLATATKPDTLMVMGYVMVGAIENIGNLMLLVLTLPLVGMWVKILQIPRPYLYAGIITFAGLGAFAANFTPADVVLLLLIGLLGFFMRRYGYPVAPIVIGLILGPMFEAQLRRALSISQGDPVALVQSPFALVVYVALIAIFALSAWLKRRQRRLEQTLSTDATSPAVAGTGQREDT